MPRQSTMRTDGTPAGVAVASAIASGSVTPWLRASSTQRASVSSGSMRRPRTRRSRCLRLAEVDDAQGGQQTHDLIGRVELEPAHREVRAHSELVVIVLEELPGRHEVDGQRVARKVPVVE